MQKSNKSVVPLHEFMFSHVHLHPYLFLLFEQYNMFKLNVLYMKHRPNKKFQFSVMNVSRVYLDLRVQNEACATSRNISKNRYYQVINMSSFVPLALVQADTIFEIWILKDNLFKKKLFQKEDCYFPYTLINFRLWCLWVSDNKIFNRFGLVYGA